MIALSKTEPLTIESEALNLIDEVINKTEEQLAIENAADYDALQYQLLKKAFSFHYEQNRRYRDFCDKVGFKPAQFKQLEEYTKIPLITSSQFKLSDVLSVDKASIVKTCTSSGTLGSISNVYRDDITLGRFLSGMFNLLDKDLGIKDAFTIHLGPPKEVAGDLWFSYIMSTTDAIFPTLNCVEQDTLNIQKVLDAIQTERSQYENILVIGAPIMFLVLFEEMEKRNIKIKNADNFYIITGGGWKKFGGKALNRKDFEEKCQQYFEHIPTKNIRDFFNMVELNTVITEKEDKIKTLPVWAKIAILDFETLKPIKEMNKEGLIAFYDTTANSYPGFILTDDIGMLIEGANESGKRKLHTQSFKITRRVKSIESRGCALKLDKNYSKK